MKPHSSPGRLLAAGMLLLAGLLPACKKDEKTTTNNNEVIEPIVVGDGLPVDPKSNVVGQGMGKGSGRGPMGGAPAGAGLGGPMENMKSARAGNRLPAPPGMPPPPGAPNLRKAKPGDAPGNDLSEKNNEAYEGTQDPPFKLVTQDALSTFSSDVDTASYSNIRRFLSQEKRLPPKDAVRIEEMINYFNYGYTGPKDEHPVAIHPELTNCPWNPKHKLLRIGVQSRLLSLTEMPPRNFVFLVDSSGSMGQENKLPLLQKSLGMLIDQLTERDRVAIVTYAGDARLVLDATSGDQREKIRAAVQSITSSGSTNGGGGIQMAYDIATKNLIPGGLNRVILGTDGDFNVGISSDGELVKLIEDKRKTGVFLTILGYGMGNLKDGRMEKLAHHGNGHYGYIDSEREARKLFVEQGAALVTVAKDVKFQIEFNPKHVAGYRLIGYANRILAHQDFNDDQKDAGDMGSGHSVTVLYELVPAGAQVEVPGIDPLKYQETKPTTASEGDEWLTIKLRYKDPEAETSKLLSVAVKGADFQANPSDNTEFASAVAAFGMLLRDSLHRGVITLSAIAEIAAAGIGPDVGGHRAEFIQLVQIAAGMKR